MTKKKIIISAVILILLVTAGCIVWRCRSYFIGTSSAPVEAKENEDFGIADFRSSVDRDGDGIDDQTDCGNSSMRILKSGTDYKERYGL